MTIEDIFTILVQQDMITVDTAFPNSARPSPGQSIKFPRGRKNGIPRKHLQRPNPQKQTEGGNKPDMPFVAPAHYEISWNQDKVERWLEAWEKKGYLRLKPEKLKWTPFVLSRTKAGVELRQAEVGLDFAAMSHTGTPQSPMDGGTPMLDIGARAKSLGSNQSSNEQNEQVVVVRDAVEVTAAHLFDDLLPEKIAPPKKQLRNKLRDASPDSIAMSTRLASARAVLDGDCGPNGENSDDALLVGTSDVVQSIEDAIPTTPIKRRRGRPPRARPPDKAPAVSQSFSTESRVTSPPKSTSPRKRRKLESLSPEDMRPSMDLAYTERRDSRDGQPVDHHPLVVNGDGHTTNGIRWASTRRSPDASLAVGTAEGEEELGQREDIAQQECTDVKSEDLGTPLTGLTSRHSVPSDDTVFVAEGAICAVVRSKISGEGEGISQPQGTGDGTKDAVALQVVVEEDSDLDAEGEPDDEI